MIDLLGLPPTRSVVVSNCGKYRYHLYRKLGEGRRSATFIMLNPSTADHKFDDPTIRKVMGFVRRWGCDELHVVNLFAFHATKPADLRAATDPVGPENRAWLRRVVELARDGLVVCAWGVHGASMGQDRAVLRWIRGLCQPMCLGLTRDGHPRHPLHVPYSAEPIAFNPAYQSLPLPSPVHSTPHRSRSRGRSLRPVLGPASLKAVARAARSPAT
jgi:hypothetical protein